MRRRPLTLALVTAGAALVAPAAAGAPSAVCAASATAGQIRVAVVVDRGTGSPSTVCVTVDDRATGAELLEARARQLGTPPPRYEEGLLCSIDGYPESGCVGEADGGYQYWAYWHGDGSGGWAYSSLGPASYRVREGDVEGWSFQSGTSEARATRPRTAPTPCPDPDPEPEPATAPVPTTTRAVATTAVPPAPTAAVTTTIAVAVTSTTTTTTTVAATTTTTTSSDDDDGSGAPIGLLAALGGALALAVAAGVRFRR